MVAQVVLDLPIATPFHYKIPAGFQSTVQVGQWVQVPFKSDLRYGVVIGVQEEYPDLPQGLKEIDSILNSTHPLPRDLLELARWISEYYCCSWGEAMGSTLPRGVLKGKFDEIPRSSNDRVESVPSKLELTPAQRECLTTVDSALTRGEFKTFLLHGVTASGKTEVYLRTIESALSLGKSSILLVPEIALTPQLTDLLKDRFRDRVALLHSALSRSERIWQWKRIAQGLAPVVIGARSAIFAPLINLGLIVMDEEQEHTYKQEETPRYHAREVAIERAKINRAIVLLGSATPSLESYAKVKNGIYRLLTLPERVEKKPMPQIQVVDMRDEVRQNRRFSVFSRTLCSAIEEVLRQGQQGILFINRRGFAPFVQCQFCGEVMHCKRCSVGLTFHSRMNRLLCHYCNDRVDLPSFCPNCERPSLRYLGIGTEKVESELVRLFPTVRIARLDSDAVQKRGAHEKVFRRFQNHELDFLVGTQMVAKGFDFPQVTLVGVVLADVTLHLADFRSAERTFQLLTQVAGRSGRGERPGRVIIQTFSPDHYAIQKAKQNDYEGFFAQELGYRTQTRFPPVVQLANILLKGKDEAKVVRSGKEIAKKFKDEALGRFEVLGPAPAPVRRLRNQFYWQILLRSDRLGELSDWVGEILQSLRKPSGITLKVDVDPY